MDSRKIHHPPQIVINLKKTQKDRIGVNFVALFSKLLFILYFIPLFKD